MDLIQEQLKTIEAYIIKQNILCKEAITFEEGAIYLGFSKSALYKMTSNKEIPYYVPGGKKIFFKRTELDLWIFKNKISPNSDYVLENENYLNRNLISKL